MSAETEKMTPGIISRHSQIFAWGRQQTMTSIRIDESRTPTSPQIKVHSVTIIPICSVPNYFKKRRVENRVL